MCGIAGFLLPEHDRDESADSLARCALRMANAMRARGPDDAGTWADANSGIAFGFRRLAILDLTPAGHQPMTSPSGHHVMVFNGEIYNHTELRRMLVRNGTSFRGHSDTEVLLAGIEAWGFESTLNKLVGMFAIALWDRRDRVLRLARDRMGEKPLYYGLSGRSLVFASELKALWAHPDFAGRIDRAALRKFMRHGWIPSPHSIYEDIYKLPPGCTISIDCQHLESRELPAPNSYWSVADAARDGQESRFALSDEEATDELERRLIKSVAGQMVADVPVGAFLSGGIDSSTIVALMQSQSSRRVRTFSIGFEDATYNEANHARAVAQYLRTQHTELYVTAEQAQAVIARIPEIYDEPFADSSQIPTYLLAELAKRDVTVSLSGDGGDELFEGYDRYSHARKLWRLAHLMPPGLRNLVSHRVPDGAARESRRKASFLHRWFAHIVKPSTSWQRAHRALDVLRCKHFPHLYRNLISQWSDADAIVMDVGCSDGDLWKSCELNEVGRTMRFFDQTGYLPDDILVKVDRAAMAVGLETRVPLLDHRIVEFAWRLPPRLLRRHGKTKWLLRQVLYKHVPAQLVERPKMGFGVPIGSWLRGPLREWAENLLDQRQLHEDGYLNAALIQGRWMEHLSGTRNWQHQLWTVLMFQAWRQHSASQSFSLTNAA